MFAQPPAPPLTPLICHPAKVISLESDGGQGAHVKIHASISSNEAARDAAAAVAVTVHDWTFSLQSDTHAPPPSAGGVASTHASSLERFLDASTSWDGLEAGYMVEWPLHLILTRDAMTAYSKLFGLLWATTRTTVELELLWPLLMDPRYRRLPSEDNVWLRPLQSLHGRMLFFVKNLQIYLQVRLVVPIRSCEHLTGSVLASCSQGRRG